VANSSKTEIRIVAGSLRGRRLTVFVHEGLRPTPQRVRESFFSILGNAVPERPFVDVFAGTGVVGLEALSRGASSATFVERDNRLGNDIEAHLREFGLTREGQLLITSPEDSSIKLWEGDRARTLIADPNLRWPDSMAEAPDGSIYVTASRIQDSAWFNKDAPAALPTKLYRMLKT